MAQFLKVNAGPVAGDGIETLILQFKCVIQKLRELML
jgi:hypothetical protein